MQILLVACFISKKLGFDNTEELDSFINEEFESFEQAEKSGAVSSKTVPVRKLCLSNAETSLDKTIQELNKIKYSITCSSYEFFLFEASFVKEQLKEIGKQNDRIYEKAIIDVTGLFSKIYLEEYIQFLQNQIKDSKIAFLMSGIDNFGKYNLLYGHPQGDIALTEIASIFKKNLEEALMNEERMFVARYGGEEFCAFIENFHYDEEEVLKRAEKIRREVEETEIGTYKGSNLINEGYKYLTMTVAGGCIKPKEHIRSFIKRVDDELKSKNKKGKNRVYITG